MKTASDQFSYDDIFDTIDSWSTDELKQFIEKFRNKYSFLISLPLKEYVEKRKAYVPPNSVL